MKIAAQVRRCWYYQSTDTYIGVPSQVYISTYWQEEALIPERVVLFVSMAGSEPLEITGWGYHYSGMSCMYRQFQLRCTQRKTYRCLSRFHEILTKLELGIA